MNNYITNIFGLPLEILTDIKYEFKQVEGTQILMIKPGTIRQEVYECDMCHFINKHKIKEYKPIYNKYTTSNDFLVILNVNKKRFVCHDYKSTFTESIPGIAKYARISNNLKEKIKNNFIFNKAGKDIAIQTFVSSSTVSRISCRLEKELDKIIYRFLPKHLEFDEFKTVTDKSKSMACILVDHETRKPFNILSSRKSKYFRQMF